MESLAPKRLNDLHPEVFHDRCQPTSISLIVAVSHVLQGVSVLYDCTLLCSWFFVHIVVNLMVVCFQHMWSGQADVNILAGPLVGHNQAP